MMRGSHAWGLLLGAVVVYDFLSPQGETLSEAVDRAMERNKTLTTVAVVLTALHLLNMIEDRHDPVHLMFLGMKRVRF